MLGPNSITIVSSSIFATLATIPPIVTIVSPTAIREDRLLDFREEFFTKYGYEL